MAEDKADKPVPSFFVGQEVAQKMINNYVDKKYQNACKHLGKEDTRSVWYTKDHIEKLLKEIDISNGSGLRFYFGAYGDDHKEFAGQTCLIVYPTRKKYVENKPVDIDIVVEKEDSFPNRIQEGFNFGRPCPPKCDGANTGGGG